jgi:hypothetical protein
VRPFLNWKSSLGVKQQSLTRSAGFTYGLDRLKPRASKFRGPPPKVKLSYFKLYYRRGRDRIVVGFTTTCAIPITTLVYKWVWILLMTRCTQKIFMWWSLSVTYGRYVVFSWYFGFPHQCNWPPRYDWTIVEYIIAVIYLHRRNQHQSVCRQSVQYPYAIHLQR